MRMCNALSRRVLAAAALGALTLAGCAEMPTFLPTFRQVQRPLPASETGVQTPSSAPDTGPNDLPTRQGWR